MSCFQQDEAKDADFEKSLLIMDDPEQKDFPDESSAEMGKLGIRTYYTYSGPTESQIKRATSGKDAAGNQIDGLGSAELKEPMEPVPNPDGGGTTDVCIMQNTQGRTLQIEIYHDQCIQRKRSHLPKEFQLNDSIVDC